METNILPDCEHVQQMRQDLIAKLGLIVVAEKHLPPIITDGMYDKTLDELRETTEQAIGADNV